MEELYQKGFTSVAESLSISKKNNLDYSLSYPDLTSKSKKGKTIYPYPKQCHEWYSKVFESLENPEVVTVPVLSGEDCVYVGFNVPDKFKDSFNDKSFEEFLKDNKFEYKNDISGDYFVYQVKCEYPFKFKDTFNNLFISFLIKCGVFEPDDDSDDEMEFNLNDF